MKHVFITYSSEDRDRAENIAHILEGEGLSIWWDRTIPPGKAFDEVIEEALDSSRCVVVLWTKSSIRSQWVKAEASEGLRRGMLVPLLLDDVKIPLEFRRIQAACLIDWPGTGAHPELEKFLRSVRAILDLTNEGIGGGRREIPSDLPVASRRRFTLPAPVLIGLAVAVLISLLVMSERRGDEQRLPIEALRDYKVDIYFDPVNMDNLSLAERIAGSLNREGIVRQVVLVPCDSSFRRLMGPPATFEIRYFARLEETEARELQQVLQRLVHLNLNEVALREVETPTPGTLSLVLFCSRDGSAEGD